MGGRVVVLDNGGANIKLGFADSTQPERFVAMHRGHAHVLLSNSAG